MSCSHRLPFKRASILSLELKYCPNHSLPATVQPLKSSSRSGWSSPGSSIHPPLSNLWIILGAWRCLPSTLPGAGLQLSHQRFGTVLSASVAVVTARRAASFSSAVEACLKDRYAAERSEQACGRSSSLLNSFFRTTSGTCLTQQGEYSCTYEDQQIRERRI